MENQDETDHYKRNPLDILKFLFFSEPEFVVVIIIVILFIYAMKYSWSCSGHILYSCSV